MSCKVKPLPDAGVVNHIIYPHELLHMMFKKYRDQFTLHLGADPAKLRSFWARFLPTDHGRALVSSKPQLQGKTASDLDHLVPLICHGDAAPVTHKKGAMFAQWGGHVLAILKPVP